MTGEADPKAQDRSPRRVLGGLASALALSPVQTVVAIFLGATLGAVALARPDNPFPLAGVALSLALAWAAMIDVDRHRLPDLLTIPLIAGGLLYWAVTDASQALHQLIGAAAGYLSLVLVALVYRLLRHREGLGRGDAKLLAAAGAWLGWKALPLVVLAGSVSALVFVLILAAIRGRQILAQPLAFGPFLAAAFWLLWTIRPWPVA